MDGLHHEFSVLSKAVSYKNISTAADNIGLSQPQISRIIAKLEGQLDVVLLDRGSRRNAAWTPAANELSQLYKNRMQSLNTEIRQIVSDKIPKFVHVATLEGLISYACDFCNQLFKNTMIEGIELNVFDLSLLEEKFVKHKTDFVLTSRQPGHKKYNLCRILGYQTLAHRALSDDFTVLSTYEQNLRSAKMYKKIKPDEKTIISNSLVVRKYWIDHFGGTGLIPSDLHQESNETENETPVLLLAQNDFNLNLWHQIKSFKLVKHEDSK